MNCMNTLQCLNLHTQDYSFRTSLYPVIISIENHCSEDQQSKMAKIFRAIMGEVLPSENLVEIEGRERLPSPLELQGKIILKGSFKGEVSERTHTLTHSHTHTHTHTLTSVFFLCLQIKGAGTALRPQRSVSTFDKY